MSVLIKGMDMPKNGCNNCFLRLGNYCRQIPTDESMIPYAEKGARHPDCPLVHVPPHGRLIDAHALHTAGYEVFEKYADKPDAREALKEIEKLITGAPTIIPAEEEKT